MLKMASEWKNWNGRGGGGGVRVRVILDLNPRRRFPESIQSGVKFYFCPKSSLLIQRVLEFKVQQLPVSKATTFFTLTPCKRAVIFISTIHVENR